MMENNKYYPINYTMPSSLRQFCTCITEDKELQKRLYNTDTIVEVSNIAKENGFDVSPVEVLKSQAGRVLSIINEKLIDDINILVDGGKPKTGAQWGRGGNGYLDKAGYWFITLHSDFAANSRPEDEQIYNIFNHISSNSDLYNEVLKAKTMTDISNVLKNNSISIKAAKLLAYQASVILTLDDEIAIKVSS